MPCPISVSESSKPKRRTYSSMTFLICFSFSAPFSWGRKGRSGYCSQSEWLHSGRDPKDSEGGTGKAEDAKLPGAGIIPKPCPRKRRRKRERWIGSSAYGSPEGCQAALSEYGGQDE